MMSFTSSGYGTQHPSVFLQIQDLFGSAKYDFLECGALMVNCVLFPFADSEGSNSLSNRGIDLVTEALVAPSKGSSWFSAGSTKNAFLFFFFFANAPFHTHFIKIFNRNIHVPYLYLV